MPDENAVVEEVEEVVEDSENVEYGDGFDVFADESEDTETVEETVTTTTEDEGSKTDTGKEDDTKDDETKTDPEKVKTETDDVINSGFKGAYQAEKAKRQAYEDILKDLNINPGQTDQKKPEKEPEPEFDWTNPEKTISSLRTEMKTDVLVMKADLSEAQCKRNHPDYDEKYAVFEGLCKADPAVFNKMLEQPDPAEWAYQHVKKHESMAEIGNDPVAYREKMRSELKAEILAELKADGIEETIKKVTLPPSGNANTGKIVKQEPETDDPLGEIFGDR